MHALETINIKILYYEKYYVEKFNNELPPLAKEVNKLYKPVLN